MAEPLDFVMTQKAAKNGSREGLGVERAESIVQGGGLPPRKGFLYETAQQASAEAIAGVAALFSAPGEPHPNGDSVFHQAGNVTWQFDMLALYDAGMFSGELPDGSMLRHPFEPGNPPLDKQETVYDKILAAIAAIGSPAAPKASPSKKPAVDKP